MGWVELVRLEIGGGPVCAKIDTGADHSSLDAREIEIFARDGQDWVRFGIVGTDGVVTTHERPLVRMTRVKRHGLDSHDRPVVAIGICLGTKYKVTEVNLADRSRFEHPVLIGRSFLGSDFLVDPVAVFLLEPRCNEVP